MYRFTFRESPGTYLAEDVAGSVDIVDAWDLGQAMVEFELAFEEAARRAPRPLERRIGEEILERRGRWRR